MEFDEDETEADQYEDDFNSHRIAHAEQYYNSTGNIETGAFQGRENIRRR